LTSPNNGDIKPSRSRISAPVLLRTSNFTRGIDMNYPRTIYRDRRIETVVSAIEREFARPWNTEALADLVRLSPSRLRCLFKSEIGKTPAQYLKSRRLQAAELFLRTDFLGVKEVMKMAGINNHSHFEHDFKKNYGVAPAKYRDTSKA
jgi:transcriptional regulator GlxA family with amidase domain